MTPSTSHGSEKENHARAKRVAAANRGWMSEKYSSPADQEKCFYLTSPFIEPALPLSNSEHMTPVWIEDTPYEPTLLFSGESVYCIQKL